MIFLKDVETEKKYYFFVIDAHTHFGREIGHDASTFNSIITGYQGITTRLFHELNAGVQNGTIRLAPIGTESTYTAPHPFVEAAFKVFGNEFNSLNKGWVVDQTVCFPPEDIKNKNYIDFNTNELSKSYNGPINTRFLPYCRVNPIFDFPTTIKEAIIKRDITIELKKSFIDQAINEIKRSVKLGALGLKLHPLSENFLEYIPSTFISTIMDYACQCGLPIIFDCKSISVAQKILDSIEEIKRGRKNRSQLFNIIIGHACYSDHGDEKLYTEIFQNHHIFAETSMIKSDEDCRRFFTNFMKYYPYDWSDKIMIGSDVNFLDIQQSFYFVLRFLFSKQFFDLGGTPEDIQKILAGNILSLLPPHRMWIDTDDLSYDPKIFSNQSPKSISIREDENGKDFYKEILQPFENQAQFITFSPILTPDKKILVNPDKVINEINQDKFANWKFNNFYSLIKDKKGNIICDMIEEDEKILRNTQLPELGLLLSHFSHPQYEKNLISKARLNSEYFEYNSFSKKSTVMTNATARIKNPMNEQYNLINEFKKSH